MGFLSNSHLQKKILIEHLSDFMEEISTKMCLDVRICEIGRKSNDLVLERITLLQEINEPQNNNEIFNDYFGRVHLSDFNDSFFYMMVCILGKLSVLFSFEK